VKFWSNTSTSKVISGLAKYPFSQGATGEMEVQEDKRPRMPQQSIQLLSFFKRFNVFKSTPLWIASFMAEMLLHLQLKWLIVSAHEKGQM
jgi:hypothetical protein